LDEFGGTRSASGALTGGVFFHGAHVLAAALKDLSARLALSEANEVVLAGSGDGGARGVADNCDLLAESLESASASVTKVRCVVDGGGLMSPHWVTECTADRATRAERVDTLVGRRGDRSCRQENEGKMNSSALALECGDFSKLWRYIESPLFVIGNQFDADAFAKVTCGVNQNDEDFGDYEVGK